MGVMAMLCCKETEFFFFWLEIMRFLHSYIFSISWRSRPMNYALNSAISFFQKDYTYMYICSRLKSCSHKLSKLCLISKPRYDTMQISIITLGARQSLHLGSITKVKSDIMVPPGDKVLHYSTLSTNDHSLYTRQQLIAFW